jgi:hypothetical protein
VSGDGFFVYKNVTATGVTTISISQYALLHSLVVNQPSTAAANATIYASSTTASAPFVIASPQLNGISNTDYVYDCECQNGITLEVGSAATPINLTVIYR